MDERYTVGDLLEELSYAKHFAAEDTLIQRPVQICRFESPSAENDEWKETFGLLSSELATIAHPGLPIIYDHGIDDDGPYLIRQLQESTDINHHLIQHGAFSEYEAWELSHQLLEIFDAARPTGNFHGALDPTHVRYMARPSGAKLFTITDYGLAEIYNQINGSSDFFGAPYLIAPEQARGEKADEKSQLFAIGQLIFHALSGGHPWLETPFEDIQQIVQNDPLGPIIDYNPSIPEGFSNWLQKMMAIDPNDRFASYQAATEELPEPIQSAPVPISASTSTVALAVAPAQVITSSHAVHSAASQHVTSAAEDFAAKKEAEDEAKKQEIVQKMSLMKNPIVIGAIAVVLVLIVVIISMSGSDEKAAEVKPVVASGDSNTGLPQEGLVSFIDFNNSSVKDKKNSSYQLEPLKNAPTFSNNGLSGKALIINKNHFYRLPIAGTPLADKSKNFTISFWMKSGSRYASDLALVSKEPWEKGNSEPFTADDTLWQWTPNKDSSLDSSSWSMITMVYSRSDNTINLFLNGQSLGKTANTAVGANSMDRFIYIGCDSNENFLHQQPITIDDLAIWEKGLHELDIQNIYDSSTAYN